MRRTVMWVLVICGLATAQGGVAADPVPNLVGTWSGGGVGVGKQDGWADDPVTLVITEQRERAFTGKKTHSEGEEGFFGAILADGRSLLLTETRATATPSAASSTRIRSRSATLKWRRCAGVLPNPREAPVDRLARAGGAVHFARPQSAATCSSALDERKFLTPKPSSRGCSDR